MMDIEDDLAQANLGCLVQEHLHSQLESLDQGFTFDAEDYNVPIVMYNSAVAKFYAPSNMLGIHGMRKERIRAIQKWRNGPGHYDIVLIWNSTASTLLSGFMVGRHQ